MYQDYNDISSSKDSARRIAALRQALQESGFDGFLVPRCDEYQGEYVAAYAERLKWLTGFSGSAGLAIVLSQKAAIFVDGRYTIQVCEQIDEKILQARHVAEQPPVEWLANEVKQGEVIGYDPWLVTMAQLARYEKAVMAAGGQLRPIESNPIDQIWHDQPARPQGKVSQQSIQFTGLSAAEKLQLIAEHLKQTSTDAVVLTLPDSVSWVLNLRGSDVAHTPVVLASAIVRQDGKVTIYAAPDKFSADIEAHLAPFGEIMPPEQLAEDVKILGTGKKLLLDKDWTPAAIANAAKSGGLEIITGSDPCIMPKACKTLAEIAGARAAHIRDGAAMVQFLHWLQKTAPGGLDEVAVAKKLESFRNATGELKDISFDTISGAGPHAAIPHYKVSHDSSRALADNEIYLIDSGGQYIDGTTDITRTVIIGTPTNEMKDRFTRVLKGMISLTQARFPPGTTGGNLDCLARIALWQAGLDFDHGTGHGVGSYLSVHEGPARFSKADNTVLKPGMILSNEPGYYKAGDYGIRIENLVVVREATEIENGERPMHRLETITLAPIDRHLIEANLLSVAEREWLNDYHRQVEKTLKPLLDGETAEWLMVACAPI